MIDWREIASQIGQYSRAWETSHEVSEEADRELLEMRARDLALITDTATGTDADNRVLTFTLDDQSFGIGLHYAREIVPVTACTPIPGTPPRLLGLFNLRGSILPLFDLRTLVGGRESASFSPGAFAIILGREQPEFGFITDSIGMIVKVPVDDLIPPPEGFRQEKEFVDAVTKDGVILLNGDILVDDPRLNLSKEARAPGQGGG